MFGYVYKVTNVDTGSFYIGKHKYKPDESFMDYLGSSSHPDFDLNNYDRKCFVKEKLADAETEQDLYNLERQYILDSLDKPGNVNSIKGVGYGGQYNYSDSDWSLKSTPNVEYVAYCESCGKVTTHYKNGACKGCTAKISYNNSDAKSYFKKSYQLKYCPVCQKETKHSGKDFTNCASCYNSKGYNLYKHDGKISLRNGTNIIIDDVTFIFDVIKDGNSFTLPKGVTVTDGTSKTNVIKFIKNSDVCNWMSLDLVSSTGWHKTITVTTDHPFVTERSDFVKAEDLTVDDVLLTNDNRPVHIRAITMIDRIADSYDLETESGFFNFSNVRSRNCRTRTISNINDLDNQIVTGRGNLSFTSINLPRLAIEAKGDIDKFYQSLDKIMEIVKNQLLHRYKIQCNKTLKNFPFLMGQGVWIYSDQLGVNDTLEQVYKHGTLSIGFIGLAETLKALIGKHHGESETAQKLGLEIITHMRNYVDKMSKQYSLNFTLLATPAEGLSGRFVKMDKKRFGIIEGVTDRDYYTNSTHVPVYYPISAYKKIQIEAPYQALCNAGHICYVELDGDPTENMDAFESVIRCMHDEGIGYGAVNHPVDRDPICGYVGIIGDTCPCCGRHEGEALTPEVYRNIIAKNRLGGIYGK